MRDGQFLHEELGSTFTNIGKYSYLSDVVEGKTFGQ